MLLLFDVGLYTSPLKYKSIQAYGDHVLLLLLHDHSRFFSSKGFSLATISFGPSLSSLP